jgi:hypothetical protein
MWLIDWLSDLAAPPLTPDQWDEKVKAWKAAKKPLMTATVSSRQLPAQVIQTLRLLERRVRDAAGSSQHRPTRQAWRAFAQETASVAATGHLTRAMQADVTLAHAVRADVEATLAGSFGRRDPVDPDQARAGIESLYAALDLPKPKTVLFLAPGLVIDPALLPPPEATQPGLPAGARPKISQMLIRQRLRAFGVGSGPAMAALAGGREFDRLMQLANSDGPPSDILAMENLAMQLARSDILQVQKDPDRHYSSFMIGSYRELAPGFVLQVARRQRVPAPMPRQAQSLLRALNQAWEHAGFTFCFDGFVVVVGRPKIATFDDQARLHNATGPALLLADDRPHYYWHGVEIAADIIERPETITAAQIKAEANTEIRRAMIERMGADRFIAATGARQVHRDPTGTLWRVELMPPLRIKELLARSNYAGLTGAERAAVEALPEHQDTIQQGEVWQGVEVINATAEKDGTFKRYVLTVPPTVVTAREAVAWTFGMTAEQYQPEIEK